MRAQRSYEPLDRSSRMFRAYVVVLANLFGNLLLGFTTLQTSPNDHGCLIQRVVTLGIQIDEHCFTTVELGIDNVAVWMGCGGGTQSLFSSAFDSITGGSRRYNYRQRASINRLTMNLLIAPGDFPKTLQAEKAR